MNEKQEFLPLAKAFQEVTGERPSPSTLCRYALKGSKGKILQSWFIRGQRMTTLHAVREFITTGEKSTVAPLTDVQRELNELLGKGKTSE